MSGPRPIGEIVAGLVRRATDNRALPVEGQMRPLATAVAIVVVVASLAIAVTGLP